MLRRRTQLGLATAVLISSCAQLPEPGGIKTPIITLGNVRYREVAVGGLVMETELLVENPNSFPVYLSAVSYTLSLGGARCGRGSVGKRLRIKPYSIRKVDVPVRLAFLDMVSSVASAIAGKRGSYSIEGEMVLRTARGDRTRDFSRRGTVNILRQAP